MNVAEFIAKWKRAELKEKSAAQEYFLDLCRLVGHPTPAEADPTGADFCFERGASKHGGGEGFVDVWKRGFFGWENKGRYKDLDAAFDQLLLYKLVSHKFWGIGYAAFRLRAIVFPQVFPQRKTDSRRLTVKRHK